MPEDILVVEYEPRYTDRVKQALNGQPFVARFARDGEEALSALSASDPRLIVLSSVIPKISTNELIRRIRGHASHQETPILITVSGYSGKSTRADAGKVGATDILPKPYSENEFLLKVKQLLNGEGGEWSELGPEFKATPVSAPSKTADVALNSADLFGDLVDDSEKKKATVKRSAEDLDKILSDTLSGIRIPGAKKKEEAPAPAPAPAATSAPAAPAAAPKPAAAKTKSAALDELLSQTLSGLEKSAKPKTVEQPLPKPNPGAPAPAPTPAPAPAAAKPAATPEPAPAPPKPVAPPAPAPAPAPTPQAAKPAAPAPVEPPRAAAAAAPVVASKPEPVKHEEDEDPTDGVRFGQYVLRERIATGGMAEVWKARMRGVEGFQKTVAIKKILPHLSDNEEFIEMFVDEAKLAAQLSHNNIIHIYDLGKIANSYYIAMEYIDGHDLKSILRRGDDRGHPVPIELALFVASKIAAALDYAHRKRDFDEKDLGLVHRDVSPQNVLISYEGDIKLCDFGIAKAASKASHTQAGALKGKLQYMSPEQAWGKKIDKRSDIFALGTVLYELLTGRKLFTGDNELSILEQVREARVSRVSDVNDEATPEIDRIVEKALQKEPESRYQTAGEMARDLDQVLYSFRPTPTSADLAIYMHRLYNEDPAELQESAPVAGPRLVEAPVQPKIDLLSVPEVIEIPAAPPEPEPVVAPAPAPVIAAPLPPPVAAPAAMAETASMFSAANAEESEKKFPVVPVAAAAVLLVGGLIAFVATRGKDAPAASAQTAATQTATAASALPLPTATTAPLTSTVSPTAVAQELGTTDQALIDQEVQKRLAAERAKLEQLRAQQAAAQQKNTPAAATPAAASVADNTPAPQTQTVAPAPTPIPEPPPATATQAAAEPQQPAAQQPEQQQQRAREGDLVEAGADGLVAPAVVRMREPNYPPAAKQRKIQGVVVVSALVSETGRVLEARVLRSVNPDLGLGAAALEAVRGATFRPATKDGVRVRTYTSVAVTFKL